MHPLYVLNELNEYPDLVLKCHGKSMQQTLLLQYKPQNLHHTKGTIFQNTIASM